MSSRSADAPPAWRFGAAVALAVACGGCGRHEAPVAGASARSDGGLAPTGADGAAATNDASTLVELAGASLPFPDSIRAERWDEAEATIAKLPPAEQAKPEVRYARARVAMARGAHEGALRFLDKLEDDLPLLRDAVLAMRADAMREVGPYDKAAEHFGSRPSVAAWLVAADAWKKVPDPARVRAACDRVVADAKRTRAQEEKARGLRMPIVRDKEGDPAAAADARWLATYALESEHVRAAAEVLEALGKPLGGDELLARAKTLAEAGRTDEALRVLERAERAKKPPSSNELCRARAEAYFKARTRYPDAALTYRQCANMGGPHAAEDLFLAARAFSRADRDGDALPAFQAVVQRHPKSTWAEQAAFHIARTHALAGRWRDAATAFDEYKKHHPNGKDRREADRYRAVAHLVAKNHKTARKLLEEQAGSAEDPIAQARWINLAALAALRDGDRTHALGRWLEVARSRPLTWPALVARARLTQAQAPLPLTIEPPETGQPPEPLPNAGLPTPADLLHRVGLDAEAEEALRAREAVVVGKANGRGTEALCAAYAELDRAKRRYQVSFATPAALLSTAPGPRNRWAWDCAFPRPHRSLVRAQDAAVKVSSDFVWAVMRQESAFDPEVVSPARAVGLLQLMPETARVVAETAKMPHEERRLTSPAHNIALGALYLREMLDKFSEREPLAAAAYNAGPEAITRWLARSRTETIDVFVEVIPFLETRGYVVKVMSNLARYGYLERGDAGVPQVTLDLPAIREPVVEPASLK